MDASTCARPGCSAPAAAWLTYDYARRTAWLDRADLASDGAWGLCESHTEGLRLPLGWSLDDRRPPVMALRPPLAV